MDSHNTHDRLFHLELEPRDPDQHLDLATLLAVTTDCMRTVSAADERVAGRPLLAGWDGHRLRVFAPPPTAWGARAAAHELRQFDLRCAGYALPHWWAPDDCPFADPSLDPRRVRTLVVCAADRDGRFLEREGVETVEKDGRELLRWITPLLTDQPLGVFPDALCHALDLAPRPMTVEAISELPCPCGSGLRTGRCCDPGRNEACPCGAGQKYKRCCGATR